MPPRHPLLLQLLAAAGMDKGALEEELAEREEQHLVAEFRRNLQYNMGKVGEGTGGATVLPCCQRWVGGALLFGMGLCPLPAAPSLHLPCRLPARLPACSRARAWRAAAARCTRPSGRRRAGACG